MPKIVSERAYFYFIFAEIQYAHVFTRSVDHQALDLYSTFTKEQQWHYPIVRSAPGLELSMLLSFPVGFWLLS